MNINVNIQYIYKYTDMSVIIAALFCRTVEEAWKMMCREEMSGFKCH